MIFLQKECSVKNAIITIEVLVALLILFLVIASSTNTIKFFQIIENKKVTIEDEYMIVLNIKEKLSHSICKEELKEEGSLNGYNYTAECEKQNELRSYQQALEVGDSSGNIGNYLMKLYGVKLNIKKDNFDKDYVYLITRGEKLQ